MDRVFLDANVLFSAAYKPDARVSKLWKLTDVMLCSSRYALEEARRNLTSENHYHRLRQLETQVQVFEARPTSAPPNIRLPEKDVPILLAAIEARADYLLTGDFAHFGRYFGKVVEGVTIIPPARYLELKSR